MNKLLKKLFSIMPLMFVFVSITAQAITAPIAADTYLDGSLNSQGRNYGNIPFINLKNNKALMGFKLAALPSNTAATNISKATLFLYVSSVTKPGKLQISPITSTWDEKTVSFLNKPLQDAALVTSGVVSQNQNYFAVDVTDLVKGWVSSGKNFGLAIEPDASSPDTAITLDSKETFSTSHAPFIEIALSSSSVMPPVCVGTGKNLQWDGTKWICATGALNCTNIALNTSRTGYPTPMESDRGWGGGADTWDILDGSMSYAEWYNGWAATGGYAPWVETAGVRHAVINFGDFKMFEKVVLWHHTAANFRDIPKNLTLEYWDGSNWKTINDVSRTVPGETSTGYAQSTSDILKFSPVRGSKLRYTFDNSSLSIKDESMSHGWLYELEVFGCN